MSISRADKNRILIKKYMDTKGLRRENGNNRYIRFAEYITDPANSHYLQSYLLLCTGLWKMNQAKEKIDEMIADFEFQDRSDSYTYSQVLHIHNEWYDYFRENIFPCGRRRPDEQRRGVSKAYVNDIMLLKNRIDLTLEDSIVFWGKLNYKFFCIQNINGN